MHAFAEKLKKTQPTTSSFSTIPKPTSRLQSDEVNLTANSRSWDFSRVPVSAQPKLVTGHAEDSLEREADDIADQAMTAKSENVSPASNPSYAGGESAAGDKGSPLPTSQRAFFEASFGHDFSGVRVHSDSRAADLASSVNARAFTWGQDIVFGPGEYQPESGAGARLLAHELAHVVQQHASQPMMQRQPTPNDPFAKGGTYDQLDLLRHGPPPEAYKVIDRSKLSFDEWKAALQSVRYKSSLAALVTLGNLKDQRAVSVLVDIVDDKFFGPKDYTADQSVALKQEAMTALAKIGGPVALAKLNDLINSKDPKVRTMAASGYSGATERGAAADLLTALKKEKDAAVKVQIIFALANVARSLGGKAKEMIVTELITQMENNTGDVLNAAVVALGRIQLRTATEPLIKQLKLWHGVALLAADIVTALGEIGDDRAVDILVIMLEQHGSVSVRSAAATALGKIRGQKALAALRGRLSKETDSAVKAAIIKAIGPPPVLHWEFKPAESHPLKPQGPS